MGDFVARFRAWLGLPPSDDPERAGVRRRLDKQEKRVIAAYRRTSKAAGEATEAARVAGEAVIDEVERK